MIFTAMICTRIFAATGETAKPVVWCSYSDAEEKSRGDQGLKPLRPVPQYSKLWSSTLEVHCTRRSTSSPISNRESHQEGASQKITKPHALDFRAFAVLELDRALRRLSFFKAGDS